MVVLRVFLFCFAAGVNALTAGLVRMPDVLSSLNAQHEPTTNNHVVIEINQDVDEINRVDELSDIDIDINEVDELDNVDEIDVDRKTDSTSDTLKNDTPLHLTPLTPGNPDTYDPKLSDELEYSSGHEFEAAVKRFHRANRSFDFRNHQGHTALHSIIRSTKNDEQTILKNLRHLFVFVHARGLRIDPNQQDENGKTPLHLAAQAGLVEVAKELVKPVDETRGRLLCVAPPFIGNAELNIHTKEGQAALDLARQELIENEDEWKRCHTDRSRDDLDDHDKMYMDGLRVKIERLKNVVCVLERAAKPKRPYDMRWLQKDLLWLKLFVVIMNCNIPVVCKASAIVIIVCALFACLVSSFL